MRRSAAALLVASAVSLPCALEAGWTDLGAMPKPVREGQSLVFKNAQGVAALSVLGPQVIRVRFSPTPAFGRDHSYAVVARDFGSTEATFDIGERQSSITTSALKVVVSHDPFRVSFLTAQGESLDEDDALRGTALLGRSWRLAKRLRDDEQLVSSITMSYSALMGGGIVTLRAELEAKDLEKTERIVLEEIAKIQETGPTEEERELAVTKFEAQHAFDTETSEGLANAYGLAETTWTLDAELGYVTRLGQITREQIRDAARRYLARSEYTRLAFVPKKAP